MRTPWFNEAQAGSEAPQPAQINSFILCLKFKSLILFRNFWFPFSGRLNWNETKPDRKRQSVKKGRGGGREREGCDIISLKTFCQILKLINKFLKYSRGYFSIVILLFISQRGNNQSWKAMHPLKAQSVLYKVANLNLTKFI